MMDEPVGNWVRYNACYASAYQKLSIVCYFIDKSTLVNNLVLLDSKPLSELIEFWWHKSIIWINDAQIPWHCMASLDQHMAPLGH